MADEFKYDVFISYSHKDETWVVETLLPALEEAGLKACIDFRDFTPGKPSRHNMRDACKESAWTLLVMTPAWVASEWTAFEGLLTFLHDPEGQRQRMIPILFEQCDIPEDIQIFTYIDFQHKDRVAKAWKQLFTVFGKPDAHIPGEPLTTLKKNDVELPENWYLAHPYAMPQNFTGRHAERNMLTNWLKSDPNHPLLIVCALGGFGKSALAWHWLTHDVDAQAFPKVVWWSFYEGDASFDNFLTETLVYLGVLNAAQINPHQKTELLLNLLQRPGLLLVLDGFERELRAYANMGAAYQADEVAQDRLDGQDTGRDCVNPYADAFLRSMAAYGGYLRSKVLMTTRLTPRAVENRAGLLQGCRAEELLAMHAGDAVDFFHAQSIRGTRAEIETACAAYGFHPLSLRILAGLVVNDRATPGDIAAAARLDVSEDIIQNKHHILEVAFNTLSPAQQKLLGRIACFRAPMGYEALKTVHGSGKGNDFFDQSLEMLEKRGLLHWDRKANQYDLHPIVRRYAYDRLSSADRAAAHTRLADYFEAIPKPEKVERLDDLAPMIELYHHMVRAGKFDDAFDLYFKQLGNLLLYQFGAYGICIELSHALFLDGEDKPPRLKNEFAQAWLQNNLAYIYSLSGQPRRSGHLFESYVSFSRKMNDKKNEVVGLNNLAYQQIIIGSLRLAESNLRRSIVLCNEIQDNYQEAIGHLELGRLLSYQGIWIEADIEFELGLKLAGKEKDPLRDTQIWIYNAQEALLMARAPSQSKATASKSAIKFAQQALNFAEEYAKNHFPVERDFARAHWLLGAAYRLDGQLDLAEAHLGESLRRCRSINLIEIEADILTELARLRYSQKKFEDAKRLAEEAVIISERSSFILQGADVNLFLAELAITLNERGAAKAYAQTALKLAHCDDEPPYFYKVAYENIIDILSRLLDPVDEEPVVLTIVSEQLEFANIVTTKIKISNQSEYPLKNFKLRLLKSDSYNIEGPLEQKEALLSKGSQVYGFSIHPKADQIVLEFETSFVNFLDKPKIFSYPRKLELIRKNREFTEVINPYVVGDPLSPSERGTFVGRDDVFTWVENNLKNTVRNGVLILHGQRRTGKTSILLHLQTRLKPPIYPVYIDLQNILDKGNHVFLYKISVVINDVLVKFGIRPPENNQIRLPDTTGVEFDAYLGEVRKLIGKDGLIVVMMDEFEKFDEMVKDGRLQANMYDKIRSLIQHEPNLRFILAGTHRLEDMSPQFKKMFLNIGPHFEITFMSKRNTDELIINPVAPIVKYDKDVIEQIWDLTAGHPYFIQVICYNIIQLMDEYKESNIVSPKICKEAIEYILNNERNQFDYLWDESTEEEKAILSTIADECASMQQFLSRDKLMQRTILEKRKCDKALERLQSRHLLKRSGTREIEYGFTFDLFKQWVVRYYQQEAPNEI